MRLRCQGCGASWWSAAGRAMIDRGERCDRCGQLLETTEEEAARTEQTSRFRRALRVVEGGGAARRES